MRILISGGSGLVGRALVRELEEAGHRCDILSRAAQRSQRVFDRARVHSWDTRSVEPLLDLMQAADAVVHLAGENIGAGRWSARRKQLIRDSRVDSTRAIVDAMLQASSPPAVLIQASAVGYYGPRGDEQIAEDTPAGDDFLATLCRDWERASERVSAAGVRRAVVRSGLVLSGDGGVLPRMALPFRLFAGGPAGNGRQWIPWIHLADEAAAIRFLLEQEGAEGAFNLTAPNPVTNREFGRTLGRVLHRPSLLPAPAFALRVVLGEMADLVLTGQRAVPRRLLELGFRFRFPDLEPALEDLLQ